MRRVLRSRVTLAMLLLPLIASGEAPALPPAPTFPCEKAPEFHQFDFWVGEWDVMEGDKPAGRNAISVREHGCLLLEEWTGASGSTGTSINYYDPARRQWVQVWVSSGGMVAELAGELRDGSMELAGDAYYYTGGRRTSFRGIWTPLPDGRVRQYFEESSDGGQTWKPWFEGFYARTAPASGN